MPLIQNTNQWYEEVRLLAQGTVVNQPPEVSEPGTTRNSDWFHESDEELRQMPGRLFRLKFTDMPVRGMFEWVRKDHSRLTIVHSGKEMWVSPDGQVWDRVHIHPISTDAIVTYDVVTPDDILIFADGVNPVSQWPGVGAVTNLPLPLLVTNARIVRFFKNRTILIDVVEAGAQLGYRIHWGEPLVYDSWDPEFGANFVDYGDGGGGILMALIFNDTLVLLKEERIGVLNHTAETLDVPFRLADYAQLPGTNYPHSAVVSPRGILYFTPDGVRQFDGERTILVTGKVGLQLTSVSTRLRNQVVAAWDGRRLRYMLAVPQAGSSVNDRLWEVHFDESEISLLLRKATVYRRTQNVTVMGFIHYERPYRFKDLSAKFSQMGVAFNDPTVVASTPTFISGDRLGNFYEHEVTNIPDSMPFVELGPYPKDPLPTAQLSKRLSVVRLRGRKRYNAQVRVMVRPMHRADWIVLRVVDFGDYTDRETIEIPADGLEGEQFFIRFERVSGQPQIVNCLLMGTTLTTLRRTRAA